MPKHPGGRPTKLTPKAKQQVAAYLHYCVENNTVPTAARLAVTLDVSKSTLYKWAENDVEFSDTLSKLQSIQEAVLIDGSLANKLNPTISKLMLANHGYSDSVKQDLKVQEVKPILGGQSVHTNNSSDQAS